MAESNPSFFDPPPPMLGPHFVPANNFPAEQLNLGLKPNPPPIASTRFFVLLTTAVFVIGFIIFGCWVGYLMVDDPKRFFDGKLTGNWIDVPYFVTVTITTLGYGDIYPREEQYKTQLWTSIFILFSVTSCAAMFGTIHHYLGLIEGKLARRFANRFFIADDTIRTRYKYGLAVSIIIMFLIIGTVIHYLFEHQEEPGKRNLSESIYFSAVTITTVGYGDIKLTTKGGRAAAIPFILFSNLFVGIGIAFIAEGSLRQWRRNRIHRILNEDFDQNQFAHVVGVEGVIRLRAYQMYMIERMLGMEAARDLAAINHNFRELSGTFADYITVLDVVQGI